MCVCVCVCIYAMLKINPGFSHNERKSNLFLLKLRKYKRASL